MTEPQAPSPSAVRIRFSRTDAFRSLDTGLRAALKRFFSLDDGALDRLLETKTCELVSVPLTDTDWDRLVTRLAQAGLHIERRPALVRYPACTKHPRLLAEERCPRCKERTCAACVHLEPTGWCPRCTLQKQRRARWKRVRVGVLLAILFAVALSTFMETRRLQSWSEPIRVGVFVFAAEDTPEVHAHVQALRDQRLPAIEHFMAEQWGRYRGTEPFALTVMVEDVLTEKPPAPPDSNASVLSIILWSLHLRYWAWVHTRAYEDHEIRLFVLYYQAQKNRILDHSFGLEKGRIGIVNAFGADKAHARNQVVMTHELLHTLGASDKYDPEGHPIFPDGFPYPEQGRAYPQFEAEIMAGRVAKTPEKSIIPKSLQDCVVGVTTAAEIGWRID